MHQVAGGGFTRHPVGMTGSEFYQLSVMDGKPTRLMGVHDHHGVFPHFCGRPYRR
jgi:hypothetical protein